MQTLQTLETLEQVKTRYPNFVLDGYIFIHRAMDKDMRDLSRVAVRLESISKEDLGKLNKWFAFVWEMIEHHHKGEDDLVFPLITKKVALPTESVLTADHHELDAMVLEIGENFKELEALSVGSLYDTLCQRQKGLVTSFSFKLTDHLLREEEVVFDLLNKHFEAKEQEAIEQAVFKSTPMKHMSKLVPWVASALTPEEVRIGLKNMPLPLRLMYNLRWKKQYEKFAAVARAA